MKIYTKTGDKGTTRLVDGSCVEKFNPRVEAYGCVDELNSVLGVIRCLINDQKDSAISALSVRIEKIQNQLFNVGSLLATDKKDVFDKLPQIHEKHITSLENWIDESEAALPELRNFILPGGHMIASQFHVARTFCRRAERRSSEIFAKGDHYSAVLIYLNRLSDLLFSWARFVNMKNGIADVPWKKDE